MKFSLTMMAMEPNQPLQEYLQQLIIFKNSFTISITNNINSHAII